MLDLPCRMGSSSTCNAEASHCGDFPCCRTQALEAQLQQLQCSGSVVATHWLSCLQASVAAAQGLMSCGSQWLQCSVVVAHSLSTCITSYTPQRAVWLSMPASRGDAVPALYTLCVPLQACVSSFISETFMICWGHVMWQVHNKKTIAMKNRVKYFKWHPKSIYASQVAQW